MTAHAHLDAGSMHSARRAAVHCDALLARQTPEHDLLGSFAAFGEDVARRFVRELFAIIGGAEPQCSVSPAGKIFAPALTDSIGPVAGNLLIPVGGPGGRLLASFALQPLLDRLDQMFGSTSTGANSGNSAAPADAAKGLPKSVELLIRRLENGLCAALSASLAPEHRPTIGTPRLDASLRSLAPFPAGAELAEIMLEFSTEDLPPITLHLACRLPTLARLLPMRVAADNAGAQPRMTLDAPFTDIPLPLRATLVDMIMPVRKLAGLQVGMILPVAIARSVPLSVGERAIAFGTVGEQDDRIALQIERTLIGGENQ